MPLKEYLDIRVQQYRFEKILHGLVEVLVGLKIEEPTAIKILQLFESMVAKESVWWPDSDQAILDQFSDLIDREPEIFGGNLLNSMKRLLSAGSTGSKFAPKWNLQIYGTSDEEPVDATYLPRGSAVLVNVNESDGLYALTAGHILTEVEGVEKVKHFMALWDSRGVYKQGKDLCSVEVVKNFLVEKEPLDLAVLKITDLNKKPSEVGIDLLDSLALKHCLEQSACGIVFGWGLYDYDPNRPDHLISPNMLRDVVVELAFEANHSKTVFQCSSFDERGPCKGDSGGPLVVVTEDGIKLAGIVLGTETGGKRCHSHDFPTEFLAPASVQNEILDAIKLYESQ